MTRLALAARAAAGAGLLVLSLGHAASAAAHRTDAPPPTAFGPGGSAVGLAAARQFGGAEQDVALLATFDLDKNGRLDANERRAAREYAESAGLVRNRWGRGSAHAYPPASGRALTPEDVRPYPTTPFYDTGTIRTLFLTFENADWEHELMAFKTTDVDVPATLVVDGRPYPNVGVQFHGNSSFNGVPMGFKHSMRLALDLVDERQAVQGYSTLLLLNVHEDPSFLRTVLAMQVAREYYRAPRANFVRVVINGESWGIFVNQQQFNSDMTRDLFRVTGGARWKVHGTRSERGGGLNYLGEGEAAYRYAYDLRTKEGPEPWAALRAFTRVLEQTPAASLEAAIAPHLDVDAALRFLAVENAIVNTDGYWTKASDYSLFMAPDRRFYLLPYDVNGTFASGFGPAGSRTGSLWLDPLYALGDPSKALIARLLAVPSLKARYLEYVQDVARTWLDWNRLGPIVAAYQAAIEEDVRADTRKLTSYEEFRASAAELKSFADQRRAFLLKATAVGEGSN